MICLQTENLGATTSKTILIPEYPYSHLCFFLARYPSAVILRMYLVVMIRINLILFYNLLAFLQLYKVLLADCDFSEIMINVGLTPKVVAHVSCFLNMSIPGNYSLCFFSSACVSVPLLSLAII